MVLIDNYPRFYGRTHWNSSPGSRNFPFFLSFKCNSAGSVVATSSAPKLNCEAWRKMQIRRGCTAGRFHSAGVGRLWLLGGETLLAGSRAVHRVFWGSDPGPLNPHSRHLPKLSHH